jgi:hypothetical protein
MCNAIMSYRYGNVVITEEGEGGELFGEIELTLYRLKIAVVDHSLVELLAHIHS